MNTSWALPLLGLALLYLWLAWAVNAPVDEVDDYFEDEDYDDGSEW